MCMPDLPALKNRVTLQPLQLIFHLKKTAQANSFRDVLKSSKSGGNLKSEIQVNSNTLEKWKVEFTKACVQELNRVIYLFTGIRNSCLSFHEWRYLNIVPM